MTESETPSPSNKQAFALIGQVAALLIAIVCFLNSVWCLYDLMHPKGSGEWANIGVFLTFAVNIPGCLISILLAIFIKSPLRNLRMASILVSLAAFFLPFYSPMVKKLRDEKYLQELTRQMDNQGRIESEAARKKQEDAAK